MEKIFERVVALLPIPVLAACTVVAVAAWILKDTQGLSSYAQVLFAPSFRVVAFLCVLAISGWYGSFWILRSTSRPSFGKDQRGVCVARFSNDIANDVRTHVVEELRTAVQARPEFADVRVVGIDELFHEHGEAAAFQHSSRSIS